MSETQFNDAATPLVSAFYDCFPFPGDPIQDGPPPGYNWRWCHNSVVASVHGFLRHKKEPLHILDAGCGTGVSTDYLCHLNPGTDVLAVEISEVALQIARERLNRSGAKEKVLSLRQEHRSLLDLAGEGPFQYINSVGVLHHLDKPELGLKALADLLAPEGLIHLFLYADAGRWEIHRTQRALDLLMVSKDHEGLRLGRKLLKTLPSNNRLRSHYEQRWAIDCSADSNFADMYLHPQETSFNLESLFSFINSAGLYFAGFSNPEVWETSRLLDGELLERANALSPRQQWNLIELLDPEISHFEIFLSKNQIKSPVWSNDELMRARAIVQPCLWGKPQPILGKNMEPLELNKETINVLRKVEESPHLPLAEIASAEVVRDLVDRQLLLLRV